VCSIWVACEYQAKRASTRDGKLATRKKPSFGNSGTPVPGHTTFGGQSKQPVGGADIVVPKDEYPAWHTHACKEDAPDAAVVDAAGHRRQSSPFLRLYVPAPHRCNDISRDSAAQPVDACHTRRLPLLRTSGAVAAVVAANTCRYHHLACFALLARIRVRFGSEAGWTVYHGVHGWVVGPAKVLLAVCRDFNRVFSLVQGRQDALQSPHLLEGW
jgi:hypothetical protein